MTALIKNSLFEIIIVCVLAVVIFIFTLRNNDQNSKIELYKYKYEKAQMAFDSLQIEKVQLLKSAARHINSADSAFAVFTASKKDRQNQIKIYEKNSNIIDNYTEQQLDSFFAVN